ncbi:MAG: hypothetical protein K9G36_08780 [Crocinitomicaceae bacterium]|nr:hypothetical protein [Crocinitomicaceae bacterium]MCF8411186.1 hypothetical protein [Crocinitomicaceae bacterium]MCF8444138.1 hypothetical protein [Crocinitomicaceae bacterium]
MRKISLLVLVVSATLASCSKGTVSSVSEQPVDVRSTTSDITAATLYAEQCSKCHSLEPREKYTVNQWKRIVPDMAKKANLDSNQEATILRYVLEAAKP